MADLSIFIPITKVDAQKRLVYGIATAEIEDHSGEICDYSSTKPNYEKWSADIAKTTGGKSFGNLRSMHGNVAAGKLTSINFNDDAKQIEICAKVVDDDEWRKVEEGVYTGFSQGGRYVKRWTDADGLQRYTADPSEVSLVDLPCLPTATFEMIKANGAIERRKFMPRQITNNEVVARAEQLAKAAGNPDVFAFVETARTELEKASITEAAGSPREGLTTGKEAPDGKTDKHPAPKGGAAAGHDGQDGFTGDAAVSDATNKWTVNSTDENGNPAPETTHPSKKEADTEAEERKMKGHKDVKIGIGKADGGDLSKGTPADGEEWEQVWKSKRDGATFKTKKELRDHHAHLDAIAAVQPATSDVMGKLAALNTALGIQKKDYSDDERAKMAESGEAMSDGSYPIKTAKDVENAVNDWGRTGSSPKVKAHIKSRAKAIGAEDKLPDDWKDGKGNKAAGHRDLAKGLPTAAALLCLAERLHDLKCDIFMEEKQEADDTGVPAQLKANVDALLDTIGTYVAEELEELKNGQDVDMLCPPIMACAASVPRDHFTSLLKHIDDNGGMKAVAAELAKRGARNSKADMDKIQAMHDHSCDLGAKCDKANCDDGAAGKAAGGLDLGKIEGELAKMTAERDAMIKTLEGIGPQLDEIMARVKNIESQPLPLPFAGRPRAVSKGEDGGGLGVAETDLNKLMETAEGRQALSVMMIKLAQSTPQAFGPR